MPGVSASIILGRHECILVVTLWTKQGDNDPVLISLEKEIAVLEGFAKTSNFEHHLFQLRKSDNFYCKIEYRGMQVAEIIMDNEYTTIHDTPESLKCGFRIYPVQRRIL